MAGQKLVCALLLITLFGGYTTQAQNGTATATKKAATMHARGTFAVKVLPAEAPALAKDAGLGIFSLDKSFSGDLEGTSKGEMLTGNTESSGAMAYVAIERVTAKLNGRSGSFLLMHTASMLKSDPGSAAMQVTVVPHSGTEALAGLSGTMTIIIESGKHSYDFEYQLP